MAIGCFIVFDDNPHGTYFAGQLMSGKVTLQAVKVKRVQAVALQINGFASTKWHEHQRRRQHHSHNRNFIGREDYLASTTYLLGSEQSQSVDIEPGAQTFNFACHIPIQCPTSFEGLYGHIRYKVKVVLQRPWKFNETFTKGFTVIHMVDLNFESPIIRVPAATDMQKIFCCWPCRSKPLKITASLAHTGYVPGQIIPISVLVTNDSNVPVKEIKVSLAMILTYFSTQPYRNSKSDHVTVVKHKGEGVPRHCIKNFTYDLLIPATPPTCINHCNLLQITYQVEIEAKVDARHSNEVLCVPVTIGNVPLFTAVHQQQPAGNAMMQRSLLENAGNNNGSEIGFEKEMHVAMPGRNDDVVNGIYTLPMETTQASTSTSSPWSGDANIPPPSYEEAVHMAHANITAEEAHDYGQSDFAPRYPVFSIPNPTAPDSNDSNESNGGYTNEGFEPQKSTWL